MNSGKLRLTEHYACFEGEGRTLGAATYLVRMSGCDLRCSWCDSKFSSFYDDEERKVSAAVVEKAALGSGAAWVSFTGGEPTWRPEPELAALAALCARLRRAGRKIKFETNGRRLPSPLKDCVDLWSVAPKWDGRRTGAAARTVAMDYDEKALAELNQRFAPARLQFKFVISYDKALPRASDLQQAAKILKPLARGAIVRAPVFFIPEAYAAGDYLERCRALEKTVQPLAKGLLKGWDIRVQPQMHRVLYGDNRGK